MGLNEYDYSPSQLLRIASVPVSDGCDRVSIGMALSQLHSVSTMPDELEGGCTGLDALCYHLSGVTCTNAIEALQRVLRRFEELEREKNAKQ
jgi:hypothetical protein